MNKQHFLIPAALVVFITAGVIAFDLCAPNCTGHDKYDRVVDPMDCTRFYTCSSDGTIYQGPTSCHPGYHFDELKGSCQYGDDCQPICRSCIPNCAGRDPGDLVQDPLDCTKFYVCVRDDVPSDHPLQCQPTAGVFDPDVGRCVTGDTCVAFCAPRGCHIRCDSHLELLADPHNCGKYFMCDDEFNAVGPYQCPPEWPYFNGWDCVKGGDQDVCCRPQCQPFCYPGDVQVIDPMDCTKYYICLQEGQPPESHHFTCPPGQTFQPSSSVCTAGAPCLVLCDNATTTPSPTTTQTPTTDCVKGLTCPDQGNYPMCLSCNPGYFQCSGVDQDGVPSLCDEGFLFNTDPSFPFCVEASRCPYTPPDII